MRRKIVAGNWKMNKTWSEALQLVASIHHRLEEVPSGVDLIVAVPFPYIKSVSDIIEPGLHLAAQDCSAAASGAYTGEVSAEMLASCNVKFCIVGHSERRSMHHETDELILAKVAQLLKCGITPIFCCGELLEERNAGKEKAVVSKQLQGILSLQTSELEQIVVAYEPVWAIGTGVTASPAQAQEMHAFIRSEINAAKAGSGDKLSILYGGSCKPDNAAELFALPDVDGGLIGGASLNANDFIAIALSYGK
jgi:triosephosphate isomerase